jgi:hypothetical protein
VCFSSFPTSCVSFLISPCCSLLQGCLSLPVSLFLPLLLVPPSVKGVMLFSFHFYTVQVWSTGPVTHLPSREPDGRARWCATPACEWPTDVQATNRCVSRHSRPCAGRKRIAPNKVRPATSDWRPVNCCFLHSVLFLVVPSQLATGHGICCVFIGIIHTVGRLIGPVVLLARLSPGLFFPACPRFRCLPSRQNEFRHSTHSQPVRHSRQS